MSQVNEISDNGTVLNHVLSIINACRISLENPSHGSCIVSSLAASDFLRSLGFAAETKSVVLSQSDIVNGQVRQVLVGGRALVGSSKPVAGGWDGHLVVVMPREQILIDPTIWQIRREWCAWIPNTLVVPLIPKRERQRIQGVPILARYKKDSYEAIWGENFANDGGRKKLTNGERIVKNVFVKCTNIYAGRWQSHEANEAL